MSRLVLAAMIVALVGAACGSDSYTQEDLDAAVAAAVADALATTSTTLAESVEPTTTTTTQAAETTTTTAAPTTTTTVAETTTTTEGRDLDESDPRAADAISGNAAPPLEKGEEGVLSVIGGIMSVSPYGSTSLYVIARNNTGDEVKGVEVAFTIRDGSGGLLASADTSKMYPYRVDSGGVAFGSAFLSDTELPMDAEFEFQVSSSETSERYDGQHNLVVIEHGNPDDRIIGIVENTTDTEVHLASVGAMCFDEDGEVLWFDDSFVEADALAPGGTSPVSIDLRDNDCPIYLMASRGFEK